MKIDLKADKITIVYSKMGTDFLYLVFLLCHKKERKLNFFNEKIGHFQIIEVRFV